VEKYKVPAEKLRNSCGVNNFDFKCTSELDVKTQIIGQDRAMEAIKFGLSIDQRGYNIYVAGGWGTGRNSYSKLLTKDVAKHKPAPKDWLYVNNFKNRRNPIAIGLPTGEGRNFISKMGFIIEFLKKEIDNVFSGKEYESAKAALVESYQKLTDSILEELNEIGAKFGFKFGQNDKGLVSIPLKNGVPMTEEEYKSISDEEYAKLRESSNQLSVETSDLFNKLRREEEKFAEEVKKLDSDMGKRIASFHLKEFREEYRENKSVVKYLDNLVDDIVNNLDKFKDEPPQEEHNPLAMLAPKNTEDFFARYNINLFVDNTEKEHAPVVFASNPTYSNLIGSIEYKNDMGNLTTDFSHIKPGLLHEANGGYLIVLAKDILTMPYAWKSLERSLLDGQIEIDSFLLQAGGLVPASLKPQPIPLDIKVIVIGDYRTYSILYAYDEEFRKQFKIMADFDSEMNRNKENMEKIAGFIAKQTQKNKTREFSVEAVARIIEYGSRIADNQGKLSSHLNKLVDILYESDNWADLEGMKIVEERHVEKALGMMRHRSSKYEEKIMEMFETGDYVIDVEGGKIGEINGLAVVGIGEFSFGKPSKITVSTYRGRAGIINIEREARTSGSIHDKGVMILNGFIGHKFAQERPLALTASIVFEQLYSGVEGDSASSTELYALLSSLSNKPINQSIAVTGSVNQRGIIQPIGGVNEKIEGFYKICKIKGLTGKQGVLIPHQNVKNLMLDKTIVEAVKKGDFHIYAIETIQQGIEILTGIPAGDNDGGAYEKDSIFYLVDKKLEKYAKSAFGKSDNGKNKEKEEVKEEKDTEEKDEEE
jgi:lon-related putative ATP-dependent protease